MIDVVPKKFGCRPAGPSQPRWFVKHYVLYLFSFRRSHSSFLMLTRGS